MHRLRSLKSVEIWDFGRVRFNVSPNTLQVIPGTVFYRLNDPTNSIKALKEDTVLRIRLQSHQVHTTVLQYYSMKKHKIHIHNTHESTHGEIGPV